MPSDPTARLAEIYASLPSMQCRGKCQASCGSVGMTGLEQQRIAERHGKRLPRMAAFEHSCPALGPFGTCAVYEDRPLVCRLWGLVQSMACPHGCVPDGGWLDEAKGREAMQAAIALDGDSHG